MAKKWWQNGEKQTSLALQSSLSVFKNCIQCFRSHCNRKICAMLRRFLTNILSIDHPTIPCIRAGVLLVCFQQRQGTCALHKVSCQASQNKPPMCPLPYLCPPIRCQDCYQKGVEFLSVGCVLDQSLECKIVMRSSYLCSLFQNLLDFHKLQPAST